MNRKFSNENHYPIKQGNYKDSDRKIDISQSLNDLSKKSLTEKEFYEKCKPILESHSDKFGLSLSKIFSILIEKGFSAYQLFKMLMNPKLKALAVDDEIGFYPHIYQIMKTQKESVIIEGLKVLGYMTSECLQNISQKTQVEIVEFLMQYTKPDIKNQGLLRLSFNCMGNIFTHSNFKIHDDKNELFSNTYELLKILSPIEALEDSNNVRLLSAMLRVLNYLFVDIKNFPLSTLDFFITQLIRYLYLGTVFFPLPKSAYFAQNDASSDSGIYTSSSEISDQDEGEEKKKHDETCSKIRNYCAASLASLFRQNPKSIPQYLLLLLPRKVFTKDLRKISQKIQDPLITSNEPIAEKKKKRMMTLLDLKAEFNDPNLLYLLLFEESNKIRLSVSKAISAILDGYHNDKLLLTIDGERLEKSKIDPYSSKSHEFYMFFKNLSLGILISLQVEIDESFVNHLLRLFATMISHQSYEKVGFLTLDIFINNVILKILPRYYHHTIYLSCISCFSSIVSGKIKFKNFDQLALNKNFDIINVLLKEIKNSLDVVSTSKEVKFLKGDRIADSTILLESIISLSKFPKHYVENLLEKIDDLISITEKVKTLDRKYSNVAYKLIEETMRYISTDKGDFENQEPEIENLTKQAVVTTPPKFKCVENIKIFHGFLEKLFISLFKNENTEFLEYVLNILYYLDENDWKEFYPTSKTFLIESIEKLNSLSSLKQSLLRMLGKICTFNYFTKEENFPRLVFKSLKNNISEKNNNIMIKNSWVLANLCANLNRFHEFNLEENHDFLNMILVYCTSNKEKLISNGYRALGYFISNNQDELLYKLITDQSKGETICKNLREVYLRSFETYSVKVCWNICVSFSNILKTPKPKFMEVFFCEEILENMKSILTSKNNFKTQIHCVEMLHLAYDQFPKNDSFKTLTKDLSTIYFLADEGQVDIAEMRYLPQLRININKLLIKMLRDRDIVNNPGDLVDILNNMPQKFFKIVYDNLYIHYKDNQESIAQPWEEDKNDDSVMGRNLKKLDNFDEMAVKGANQNKINISTRRLHKSDMAIFKEHLADIIGICKQTATLIDTKDDINVPFSVYESIKQLADMNLDSPDEFLSLEIYQF